MLGGPVGSLHRPDDRAAFVEADARGAVVFVHRDVIERVGKQGVLRFWYEGLGACEVVLRVRAAARSWAPGRGEGEDGA